MPSSDVNEFYNLNLNLFIRKIQSMDKLIQCQYLLTDKNKFKDT